MIEETKARIVSQEKDTPGGITYHVRVEGELKSRALCFRPIHETPGYKCTNPAGGGTWHLGTGACKFHGGLAGTPIKHGKFAKQTRLRLADKIADYMDMERPKLLDLTRELATTRALFDDFVDTYPDPDSDQYSLWFQRFTTLVGTLGSLVEKISRTDARNTLTAAQVLYLRATVADILMKYIQDPGERDRAARELASRMGGDIEAEMRPSEYGIPRLEIGGQDE